MWWARHQLRVFEEMACDDLVLEAANAEVHQYGNALLNMAELLTATAIRPPVVASAINSGGSLEQRLKTMIAHKQRKVSPSLRMTIVALATCVFPLGVVHAQDFEGVQRRLGGAVEAGELTLDQAKLMLDALRRSYSSRDLEAKKRRYTQFMNEIKEAAEAGKITEEEAELKLAGVRREMFEEGIRNRRELGEMEVKKQRYKLFMDEIKAAVEAGKLTEEQAEEKLIAVRREMFEVVERGKSKSRDMEGKKRQYERLMNEMKEAVEEGDLTEEEAEMKLATIRREMFEEGLRGGRDPGEMEAKKQRYRLFMEEIKAAVEAGKLTEEQAEEKLIDMRRRVFEETP